MKMICPVCYREVSVTSKMIIRRHGYKKGRWTTSNVKVDGSPCEGSGEIGLTKQQATPYL